MAIAGPLPRRLGGMERPVPRHRAPLLAPRSRQTMPTLARLDTRLMGSSDTFELQSAAGPGPASTTSPAMTAFTTEPTWSPLSPSATTTGQWRRRGVMATGTTTDQCANYGPEGHTDRTPSRSTPICAPASSATCWPLLLVSQGVADVAGRVMRSAPQPGRQQQCLLPGQFEINWLDWEASSGDSLDMRAFVSSISPAMRRRYPVLGLRQTIIHPPFESLAQINIAVVEQRWPGAHARGALAGAPQLFLLGLYLLTEPDRGRLPVGDFQ